ncbi:MAG: hypothetical protein LAO23_13825 [Acidobacteriia bacterium]|nr:hypothetical protein [Terriglobia bacterium]
MQNTAQTLRKVLSVCPPARATMALGLLLMLGFAQSGMAQTGTNQLTIFTNYFVTGDYVVSGWVEGPPDYSGFATGTITVPDPVQAPFLQTGVKSQVPAGADVVAAFLYWSTVEGGKSTFAGQQGFFNGYPFSGTVLGNPNAPVSWSSGGCSGSANGSKTIRTYRADVRPYLPLDTNPSSSTFGRIAPNTAYTVRLADSGSNGNTAPFALGATLVLVYRVLNGNAPLNGIVLFDGIYAPSNAGQTISQTLYGFYQAAQSPFAKLTHIVANGQPNKSQNVYLNTLSEPLPSLYGSLPPFPGMYDTYGSAWDNPTWVLTRYPGYVNPLDGPSETTQVIPTQSNTGCVSWGAMILSTTVQSTGGDGLLDVWKQGFGGVPGYTDAASNQWVSLPGAKSTQKDLFVEVDYASNMDGKAGNYLHSHLPKQDALDKAAAVLAGQGITVHFDLGPGIYAGDPNVVSYPVTPPNPLPTGTLPPQAGAGGNAISESALVCTDGNPVGTLCAYPGISTIGWKGGFVLTRDTITQPTTNLPLGNFQPGRGQSYHYILVGHALGSSRSFWSTLANALSGPNLNISNLVSIAVAGTTNSGTGTVTVQSPPGLVKPGDCPNAAIPACSDTNYDRVSISGALGQQNLNGNYRFSNASSTTSNSVTTTTFTIATSGVVPGTYNFTNEPQLAVNYLGPTSTSGHSDFGGGGDSALTFGRWEADDPPGCVGDPSQTLLSGQVYCNNQVGTVQVQEGTLLHELGHTFTLTHGGAYYDPNNPTLPPTYGANCKSNFLSVMNYLFQVRGFPDGGFDYSGQPLADLFEDQLDETQGIGAAPHYTRWYGPPNALDKQLQNTVGGRYATMHCDGTPITDGAQMVRVDGTTLGSPIDWNNNLVIDPPGPVAPQDVNFDGVAEYSAYPPPPPPSLPLPPNPLQGFIDKPAIDLTQIGARTGAAGFSGGGGGFLTQGGGGFLTQGGGGFLTQGGGGFLTQGGGGFLTQGGGGFLTQGGGGFLTQGGGGFLTQGGGVEQDSDLANSTADSPTGLTAGLSGHAVVLSWTTPAFGQVREYDIWRATGSFTLQCAITNPPTCAFSDIKMLTPPPTPPSTTFTFTDTTVKNNTTYTYFVTDKNKQRVESGASNTATIYVKF